MKLAKSLALIPLLLTLPRAQAEATATGTPLRLESGRIGTRRG